MNKDEIIGDAKKVEGTIKEHVGKTFGDDKLTAEGKLKKAEGSAQHAVGELKDALKK